MLCKTLHTRLHRRCKLHTVICDSCVNKSMCLGVEVQKPSQQPSW